MASPTAALRASERPNPEHDRRQTFFEGDTLEQTIAVATEPCRTLFAVLAGTGCRISEALALRLEDLYLDDEEPRVIFRAQLDRKGQRHPLKRRGVSTSRTVWIDARLAEVLRAHVARAAVGTYVFSTRTGSPLSQRNVARSLRSAQRAARTPEGLPSFPALHLPEPVERGTVPGLHSFRHTHVSRLRHAGWSLEDIAERVGHKDTTTTAAVYTHAIEDQDRRALRREQLSTAFPVVG